MFKHFTLLALLVFITPQFLFSQDDGKYVLYNNPEIKDVVDLKTTIMLVVDINSSKKVNGTYYEYRGNSWNIIGHLSGVIEGIGKFNGEAKVYENKYKVTGTILDGSADIKREDENVGYMGWHVPDIAGIYYKSSNENDVCRVAQDGPFLELIDENSNTSKGIIISKYTIYAIEWNKSGKIDLKDEIIFSDGIKWTKGTSNSKDYTGEWLTEWGTLIIVQSGSKVTGKYEHNPTTINGTVSQEGDSLVCTGKWKADESDGDFIFKLKGEGFRGSYNYSREPGKWYDWIGSRWK
ncbi:MAG TPA: hypothetical protein VHP32_01125 [Ignavibacteria bacterium]|nr:hypothetical protein [Ignavibacteria bacterium]